MERKIPGSGEFYRHFKGNIYQVKMLANDSEDGTQMVVYQGMYPPYQCYVRKLSSFMEPVDRVKYPETKQHYRFEPICFEKNEDKKQEYVHTESNQSVDVCKDQERTAEVKAALTDEVFIKALKSGQAERYLKEYMTDKEIGERGFMALLDADTFHEKRQLFIGLKDYLDSRLLSNIAVALDIVLEEADEETQYDSILRCLDKLDHYEGGRLR